VNADILRDLLVAEQLALFLGERDTGLGSPALAGALLAEHCVCAERRSGVRRGTAVEFSS
jgi:hypothetical protein